MHIQQFELDNHAYFIVTKITSRDAVTPWAAWAWLFAAGWQHQKVRHGDGLYAVQHCLQYVALLTLSRLWS